MESGTYWTHNQAIEAERRGRTGLADGHCKHVVRAGDAAHVAIKGGLWPNGSLVQGLNTSSHDNGYVDYSHGGRLVADAVDVDGQAWAYADLLAHASYWQLVSHDGPHGSPRLPGAAPAGLGSASVPIVRYSDGSAGAPPELTLVVAEWERLHG